MLAHVGRTLSDALPSLRINRRYDGDFPLLWTNIGIMTEHGTKIPRQTCLELFSHCLAREGSVRCLRREAVSGNIARGVSTGELHERVLVIDAIFSFTMAQPFQQGRLGILQSAHKQISVAEVNKWKGHVNPRPIIDHLHRTH